MNHIINLNELEADILLAIYENPRTVFISKEIYEITKNEGGLIVRLKVAIINSGDFESGVFTFKFNPSKIEYTVVNKPIEDNLIYIKLTNSDLTEIEKRIIVSLTSNEVMRDRVPNTLKEKFNRFREKGESQHVIA